MSLPPLLAPGAPLSAEERTWFSRHLRMPEFGETAQRRLRAARVLIIGAGGLGSPAALYLAAAGVGALGIVDDDTVSVSNLQRQILHRADRVGGPKTASAQQTLTALSPHVQIEELPVRLDIDNACRIIGEWDLVIDGSDNFASRYLVNDACALTGRPSIWGSLLRFEGQYSVFWDSAPDGLGVDYRDAYPSPPPPGFAPSCAEAGVLGALCGVIGSAMALEAVKLITGVGEPMLGRLVLVDALSGRTEEVPVRRRADRRPITELEAVSEACETAVAELTPHEAHSRLSNRQALLVDVRTDEETAELAYPNAVHLPLAELMEDRTQAAALRERLASGPHRELIIGCQSGARSLQAADILTEAGIPAFSLHGGIAAWKAAGLPTERPLHADPSHSSIPGADPAGHEPIAEEQEQTP